MTKNIKLIGNGDVKFKYEGNQYFGTFNEDLSPKKIYGEYYGQGRIALGNFIVISMSHNIEIENIEVDGNIGNMIIGGPWGDTGHQIQHYGIIIRNSKNIKVIKSKFHHFGCDGILVENSDEIMGETRNDNIYLSEVISEYNGRQGMSIVGVNGIQILNSKFNHTGKNGKVSSAPGAGVDLEAEVGFVQNGVFKNCLFSYNSGCGLVADSGESRNWTFYDCTFIGVDNWSLWARKKRFKYYNCTFIGSIVNLYDGINAEDASYFQDCTFKTEIINGKPSYGKFLVELNGVYNTTFKGCSFLAKFGQTPFWIDSSMSDTTNINRFIDCNIKFDLDSSSKYYYPSVLRHVKFENTKFVINKNENNSFLDFNAIHGLIQKKSNIIVE